MMQLYGLRLASVVAPLLCGLGLAASGLSLVRAVKLLVAPPASRFEVQGEMAFPASGSATSLMVTVATPPTAQPNRPGEPGPEVTRPQMTAAVPPARTVPAGREPDGTLTTPPTRPHTPLGIATRQPGTRLGAGFTIMPRGPARSTQRVAAANGPATARSTEGRGAVPPPTRLAQKSPVVARTRPSAPFGSAAMREVAPPAGSAPGIRVFRPSFDTARIDPSGARIVAIR